MERLAFGHSAYLWGLLGIAVPILVHLFNRRRPRPLPFGAIQLVLRSQKQRSRKLRLRQLLLLLLRCLLVGGVALALARPALRPRDAQAATTAGPQATALVLDASLSMRARDGQETLFSRARAEALAALAALLPEEPATVVVCAGLAGALGGVPAPGFDRVALRRLVEGAQATALTSDLSACLSQGARALAQSPVAGKRVIAFSDLAAHAIRLDAPPPLVPASPELPDGPGTRPSVALVDVTHGKELSNLALVGVSVSPAPRLGPRGYEAVATVANYSTKPVMGAQVVLRAGGQLVAKGFVDLPARGTVKKTLGALLPAGLATGRVELVRQQEGGLDDDDAQEFAVQVPRDLKLLVVDGAPSSLRTRDEAWFVEAALSPQRSAGRLSTTVLDADAVEAKSPADLAAWDVLLLLNVGAPKRAFADRLRAYVQKGGGLFLALGDNVDPGAWNESMKDLLPRPLHLVKTAVDPAQPDGPATEPDRSARLGVIDWANPLFRVFGPQDREALASVRTFRYALLGAKGEGHTIASFDDGAPALVEGRVGLGRVLLLTTSASATWTDWPIRPSFLPVLQQAMSALAGTLDERPGSSPLVGELRGLAAPEGSRVVAVQGPDGKDLPLVLGDAREKAGAEGPPEVRVAAREAGLHRVFVEGPGGRREEPGLAFAARLDPRESDLLRVDEQELAARLGGAGTAQVASSSREAQGSRGTPLWAALFVLAALAVLGEGLLTRR